MNIEGWKQLVQEQTQLLQQQKELVQQRELAQRQRQERKQARKQARQQAKIQAQQQAKSQAKQQAKKQVKQQAKKQVKQQAETQAKQQMHFCEVSGCARKKGFGTNCDLQRHKRSCHEQSIIFHCDYRRCERSKKPFTRKDHYREHLRDFHQEALGKVKQNESKERVDPTWWRCVICLTKNSKEQSICKSCAR
jgi:hypothetical protein